MTRERAISFIPPMSRAVREDRKTKTRCIAKPRLGLTIQDVIDGGLKEHGGYRVTQDMLAPCPYGVPGDRLWVREAHYLTDDGDREYPVYAVDNEAVRVHLEQVALMRADARYERALVDRHARLRPSIHMPRWASRITLEITDVRVERLQDISEADAIAEGVYPAAIYGGVVESWLPTEDQRQRFYPTAREAFQALWDSIYGPGAWAANPWVWVISFRRVER